MSLASCRGPLTRDAGSALSCTMKDQVVFVTGAARGIGAGVSKQLAARGARIALTGLEPDELAARAAELGPGHMVYELDVTDSDSVRSAVDAVIQKYGRIVDAGTAHPSWIDTDLVRESEADLKSFRLMRANLPWPLKATTPLETCAKTIADGIEKRKARIFVPRSAALIYWMRSLLNTRPVERANEKLVAEAVPTMEREVAALGRPASTRTTAINRLQGRQDPPVDSRTSATAARR